MKEFIQNMDVIEFFLFLISIVCIIAVVVGGVVVLIEQFTELIKNYFRNKYFGSNNEKLQEKIINFFHNHYNHDVPITFCEEEYFKDHNPYAAGLCQYKTINHNLKTAHEFNIRIRSNNSWSWTTLAHEIGHYISITEHFDDSEEGADFEAGVFMLKMLSKHEQSLLHSALLICFNVGTENFKLFKHAEYKEDNENIYKNIIKLHNTKYPENNLDLFREE